MALISLLISALSEEIINKNNSEYELEELESEIRLNKDIDRMINKY